MSKPRKDKPLRMPKYRGGDSALKAFIESNLKYPQEAVDKKVEGSVEAHYDVDGLGRTFNVKIITSLGHGCDEEVKRLIGLLKFESAFNKGRNVTAHKRLKVDFKLPNPKKKTQSINYQITSSTGQNKAQKEQQPKSYTYRINLKK